MNSLNSGNADRCALALTMEYRDQAIRIQENEFITVPKETGHQPVAEQEVAAMLVETPSNLKTGNTTGDVTKPL